MYPYILTTQVLTIVIDNKQYSINSNHINFDKIVDKIKNNDTSDLIQLISIKEMIKKYSFGKITITSDDELYYGGLVIHNSLSKKIVEMFKDGFPFDPMIKFMQNLMDNPSDDAKEELYSFLEYGDMPITNDGCFLAYKKVNKDFTDCYTGTIDNSVGNIVTMNRNNVDDNRLNTCSTGLHFCSKQYLSMYPDDLPTMVLEINPKNVVSIPSDYNNTKGRACEYTVIAIYDNIAHSVGVFDKSVANIDIVKMSTKQKMVHGMMFTFFADEYSDDLNNIDLHHLKDDDNDTYQKIISYIMYLFDKPIKHDSAVRYFKFMKNNFGVQQ